MHDVVDKYVAFGTKVIPTIRTTVSTEGAHAFACGGSPYSGLLEDARACVTGACGVNRIGDAFPNTEAVNS